MTDNKIIELPNRQPLLIRTDTKEPIELRPTRVETHPINEYRTMPLHCAVHMDATARLRDRTVKGHIALTFNARMEGLAHNLHLLSQGHLIKQPGDNEPDDFPRLQPNAIPLLARDPNLIATIRSAIDPNPPGRLAYKIASMGEETVREIAGWQIFSGHHHYGHTDPEELHTLIWRDIYDVYYYLAGYPHPIHGYFVAMSLLHGSSMLELTKGAIEIEDGLLSYSTVSFLNAQLGVVRDMAREAADEHELDHKDPDYHLKARHRLGKEDPPE